MSVQDSSISSHLGGSPHGEAKKEQQIIQYGEDDWENDPQNPRNWTSVQKWTAVGVVRFRFLASYHWELTSGISFQFRYPCILLSPRCPAR